MIKLATAIQLMEEYLAEKPNLNPESIKQYEYILRRFYRWAKQNTINFQDLKIRDLVQYHSTFSDCSDLTKYSHFTVLKNHFKWMEANSYGLNRLKDGHPLARIPRRYTTFRKMYLHPPQLRALLEQPKKSTITGARDFALLLILSFNGLRLIEAIRANFGDLTENGQGLYIQRKGRKTKDELIRLSNPVQDALNDYLVMRKSLKPESPLIASHAHHHTEDFRLCSQTASRIIKKYLVSIGLAGKQYTAHSLRHTAASLLLQAGVSPHDLQRYLSHASFSTSQLYLKALDEDRIYNSNLGQKLANLVYNNHQTGNLMITPINEQISDFQTLNKNKNPHH